MITGGMHGYDSDSDDNAFGADDPIKRGGLSSLTIQLKVTNAQQLGNAAAGVNLFDQADVDAAALPTGINTPVLASYKKAVKYFLANPSLLQSIVFASNEADSTGAVVMQSFSIIPTRSTPFASQQSNALPLQQYQTTQDFKANRTTVPLRAVIDGFTLINITSAVNATGADVLVNCVFFFGARVENRKQIKGGSPLVMRPGGRGPVAVKQLPHDQVLQLEDLAAHILQGAPRETAEAHSTAVRGRRRGRRRLGVNAQRLPDRHRAAQRATGRGRAAAVDAGLRRESRWPGGDGGRKAGLDRHNAATASERDDSAGVGEPPDHFLAGHLRGRDRSAD